MASLLTLPPELLDTIISLALSDLEEPPQELPKKSDTEIDVFKTTTFRQKTYYTGIASRGPNTRASRLLLVSREVNRSTSEAISRLRRQPITYSLDIMFVNAESTVPTWTCVPFITRHVNRMDVTIRPWGRSWSFKWARPGCGGPAVCVWLFQDLMQHFFTCGTGMTEIANKSRQPCIGVLSVNFVDALPADRRPSEGVTEEEWVEERRKHTRDPESEQMAPKAKWVADHLSGYFGYLTGYADSYGQSLFDRIGRCEFKANGELLQYEVNPGEFFDQETVLDLHMPCEAYSRRGRRGIELSNWMERKKRGLVTDYEPRPGEPAYVAPVWSSDF